MDCRVDKDFRLYILHLAFAQWLLLGLLTLSVFWRDKFIVLKSSFKKTPTQHGVLFFLTCHPTWITALHGGNIFAWPPTLTDMWLMWLLGPIGSHQLLLADSTGSKDLIVPLKCVSRGVCPITFQDFFLWMGILQMLCAGSLWDGYINPIKYPLTLSLPLLRHNK